VRALGFAGGSGFRRAFGCRVDALSPGDSVIVPGVDCAAAKGDGPKAEADGDLLPDALADGVADGVADALAVGLPNTPVAEWDGVFGVDGRAGVLPVAGADAPFPSMPLVMRDWLSSLPDIGGSPSLLIEHKKGGADLPGRCRHG